MIKTNQSVNPFGKGKVQAHKHIASGAYFHTLLFRIISFSEIPSAEGYIYQAVH